MKGFTYPEPHYASALEAHTRVIAMTAHKRIPQFSPAILYEYIPLSKINSVPRNATAFMRTYQSNGIVVVSWNPAVTPGTREALDLGDVEKENTDQARELAKELAGIVLSGTAKEGTLLGYSNYGALLEDPTLSFFAFFTCGTSFC